MAFLLPLTAIAPIHGAKPPPNRRSSRAERRGEAARVCVCGRVKGEEKGRVIRVPDPIREPLGLAPLLSGPLLRESSSSSPSSPPSLRDQQREAGDDKQDCYVNMGYAIRTLREEFPDIFYKEPNFDIYRYDAVIEVKRGNPPIMPVVMTPGGPLDLSSVLFRNRIIFIGQSVNSQVAQRVISQLLTLAAVDEDADILMYLNCPGGSTYSILAIYDCMSWIKPKVGTVCFGVAASQGALLLAGGEKGMRYAMRNARIMIHQPQTGCGGHVEDVRRQVNEAVQSRHKIDKMFAAFTGQPLEKVQQYTERDRFLSASEALEFGLIDGLLETEY